VDKKKERKRKKERKKDRKNRSPPTLRGRTNEAMPFKAIACLKKMFCPHPAPVVTIV
jgi:hypothetical protein